MIEFNKRPGQKVLEIGGGDNPHEASDVRVDVRQGPFTHFVVDLEQTPWPITSAEFDAVLGFYVLEHLSFRCLPTVLTEVLRVLKPGGKAVFTVPNTEEQFRWIGKNGEGWDGKDLFAAASELLFGSQDYKENRHSCYFTPTILTQLFRNAGFDRVTVRPYGERSTDLMVEATKGMETKGSSRMPTAERVLGKEEAGKLAAFLSRVPDGIGAVMVDTDKEEWRAIGKEPEPAFAEPKQGLESIGQAPEGGNAMETAQGQIQGAAGQGGMAARTPSSVVPAQTVHLAPLADNVGTTKNLKETVSAAPLSDPSQLFDKAYFNGGGKVGGYANEGYRDFPCHWSTLRHILDRRPESVLEIGAAKGFLVKRLQDYGIPAMGLEVSRHCWLTRVCEGIILHDLCRTPWPVPQRDAVAQGDGKGGPEGFDLLYSVATLEHIPEQFLPAVIGEMQKVAKRGLHGIDFGQHDDSFDRTHCTLRSRDFWEDQFACHAPGWPVEIVDKEELESGPLPQQVLKGDGKVKLNIGCAWTMFHHGWDNLDVLDLAGFAQANGHRFRRVDVRQGIPYQTGTVHLLFLCHFLEHLTPEEGLACLKECRRVIRPDGGMRIILPDAHLLARKYLENDGRGLDEYGEINEGVENSPTPAGKYWALLHAGHAAAYDIPTVCHFLKEAGFVAKPASFRQTEMSDVGRQILRETLDLLPCLSIYCDASPATPPKLFKSAGLACASGLSLL